MNEYIRNITILGYCENNKVNICIEDVYKILHIMSRKFYTSSLGQYIKINGKRVYIKKIEEDNNENKFEEVDKLVDEYKVAISNNDEIKLKKIENSFKELGLDLLGLQFMTWTE